MIDILFWWNLSTYISCCALIWHHCELSLGDYLKCLFGGPIALMLVWIQLTEDIIIYER